MLSSSWNVAVVCESAESDIRRDSIQPTVANSGDRKANIDHMANKCTGQSLKYLQSSLQAANDELRRARIGFSAVIENSEQ